VSERVVKLVSVVVLIVRYDGIDEQRVHRSLDKARKIGGERRPRRDVPGEDFRNLRNLAPDGAILSQPVQPQAEVPAPAGGLQVANGAVAQPEPEVLV